jgi:hypothetical protein
MKKSKLTRINNIEDTMSDEIKARAALTNRDAFPIELRRVCSFYLPFDLCQLLLQLLFLAVALLMLQNRQAHTGDAAGPGRRQSGTAERRIVGYTNRRKRLFPGLILLDRRASLITANPRSFNGAEACADSITLQLQFVDAPIDCGICSRLQDRPAFDNLPLGGGTCSALAACVTAGYERQRCAAQCGGPLSR